MAKMNEDCVFCKIVKGEIPVEKVMEDENYLAFLSINPVYDGLTVMVPKIHKESYIYESMSDDEIKSFYMFAKKVAIFFKPILGCERFIQVMEGLGVNHAHLKLFPKYKDVNHAIVETEIPVDLGRIKKVAEKIREVE